MQNGRTGKTSGRFSFLQGNMLVMIVTSAVWQFAGNSVWPFFSLYVLALGGPPEMIGVISGIGTLSSILPTVLGGYLADVFGRRRMTAFFSIVLGFTSVLMALAPDWRMLAVAMVFDSLAAGFREPAMSALIADSLSSESRGLGFIAWAIVPGATSVVSPIISGYFVDSQGALLTLKWGYALTGLMALMAGVGRQMFLKETYRPSKTDARSVSAMIRAVASTPKLMTHGLWILLVSESLLWLGWSASSPYFILYGTTDVMGLTATEWGLVLLISNVAKILGFAFGSLADRYGRRNVTAVTSLLIAVSSSVFLESRTLLQVVLVFTVNSLAVLTAQQMAQALRADACPRENRSKVYSFFIIWQYLTRTVGSVLGGFLYASAARVMPFYFQTAVSLISVAVLLSLASGEIQGRR